MKASKLVALALTVMLFPGLTFAQQGSTTVNPTQQPMSVEQFDQEMAKAQENLKKMQAQMSLIQKTTDPAQRQKLMQDHQVMMQQGMHMMNGMLGCCGGGMMGAANIHMGLEDGALDTSFTFGGAEAALVKRMGLAKIDGVALRFAGSFQRDDTGEVVAVEIVQRGRFKDLDRGTFKSGDNSQTKVNMVNTYYKETMNGVDLVEIDLLNMIWIVDGVDLMAEHRKAIGL